MATYLSVVTWVLCVTLLLVLSDGQRTHLTGSAPVAVAGDPFTFFCRSNYPRMRHVFWSIQLHNNSDRILVHSFSDICFDTDRYESLYNFTCSQDGPFTLTILDVDYQLHHDSNWTCEAIIFGERSNTVLLNVNVPLAELNLHNSARSPLTVTEGEEVTLVCESNPTNPASNVSWMMLNQTLTRGVTSQSRDEGGLIVTVSILTFKASWDEHNKRIYCVGRYGDSTLQSEEFQLNVNIPLAELNLHNSARSPLTVTEGEEVTLVCESNPTNPASNVSWMMLNQTLTRGVTSQSRDEGGLIVTVSILTFKASWDEHNKRIYCVGRYGDSTLQSEEFQLNVNMPLLTVQMTNSTVNPLTVTENDILSVECTTNPTRPLSIILWSKDDHLRGVQCTGVYGGQKVTSPQLDLFVHCKRDQETLPLSITDPGFGAGVGTGIAVSLVLVTVAGGFLVYFWRQRGKKNADGKKNAYPNRGGQELSTPATETPSAQNVYDGIECSTRQVNSRDTYEDLKLYENTSA